jgi:hypothetical protein
VIVGDDDTGRIDDETGTERIDAARSALAVLRVAALTAAIEEVSEELVELRIVGQLRQRGIARFDLLRGGDIDDRIDHLLGDIGDVIGPTRGG